MAEDVLYYMLYASKNFTYFKREEVNLMPMLQFRCPDGHEFEKLMPAHKELHKWCKHCDKLTVWTVNKDSQSLLFKEKLCSNCLGNENVPPMPSHQSIQIEESIQEECKVCGKPATHVLRIESRGAHSGGPTIADSSVRFNFNYLESSDS